MHLADYPAVLFVTSLGVLLAVERIGMWFSGHIIEVREELRVLRGAALTLLGLLVAFTLTMAVGRYDLRKRCEAEEANAIGTEYLRAGLLPNAGRIRELLREYLDQRIIFYRSRDSQALAHNRATTARLQERLWDAVESAALPSGQTALVTLAVSGMNDVLNTQGYTEAAWLNRIPAEAWTLLAFIATLGNFMVGLSLQHRRSIGILIAVLPVIVSVSLLLLSDIDSPRGGLIHVRSPNLVNLAESLRP